MAEDYGLVEGRSFGWFVGAKLIPKSTVRESLHNPDGTIPWRLLSFQRRVPWPTYDRIVESHKPCVISRSGWAVFGPPMIAGICALVVFFGSLIHSWVNGHLANAETAWSLAWLLIATPLWSYYRFLRWWVEVYGVTEALISYYTGWYWPKSDSWSADSIFKVRSHIRGNLSRREYAKQNRRFRRYLATIASLFWRILLVGDIELIDPDNQAFGIIPSVANASVLRERVILPFTASSEQDARRTAIAAEATAAEAKRQTEIAMLHYIATRRTAGVSDDVIATELGVDHL